MNKADIGSRVAARLGLRKTEAVAAVDTVFEAIGESLAREESVRVAGFGTFATRSREARTGRNPRTGEAVGRPGIVGLQSAERYRVGQAGPRGPGGWTKRWRNRGDGPVGPEAVTGRL